MYCRAYPGTISRVLLWRGLLLCPYEVQLHAIEYAKSHALSDNLLVKYCKPTLRVHVRLGWFSLYTVHTFNGETRM